MKRIQAIIFATFRGAKLYLHDAKSEMLQEWKIQSAKNIRVVPPEKFVDDIIELLRWLVVACVYLIFFWAIYATTTFYYSLIEPHVKQRIQEQSLPIVASNFFTFLITGFLALAGAAITAYTLSVLRDILKACYNRGRDIAVDTSTAFKQTEPGQPE